MNKLIVTFTCIATIGFSACNNNNTQPQDKNSRQIKSQVTETIVTTPATSGEIIFKTYCNERFGFCVDYPLGVLFPQGESDNRDGQIFKSKDAETKLLVYRDFRDNIDPETQFNIETAYNEDSWGNDPDNPKRVITYKKLGKTFFVISGYNKGKIFYQKSVMTNGQLATCIIEYQEKDMAYYNKIADRIFKSFK
jgi:hypothetical protein